VGVAAALVLLSARLAATAGAAPSSPGHGGASPPPLEEKRGGVTVDWGEGTLTALGGAAGDLRMPSADLARPGAERRARAAALAQLKGALAELPLGGSRTLSAESVALALGHARPVGAVEYQSNGGALVRLQVHFTDWLAGQAPDGGALVVPEMKLEAAPRVAVGGQELTVGAARYHVGAPAAGLRAMAAKVDRQGRLVVHGDRGRGEKLAGAAIVIYVQKVLR
jgi:hypothetical protein